PPAFPWRRNGRSNSPRSRWISPIIKPPSARRPKDAGRLGRTRYLVHSHKQARGRPSAGFVPFLRSPALGFSLDRTLNCQVRFSSTATIQGCLVSRPSPLGTEGCH